MKIKQTLFGLLFMLVGIGVITAALMPAFAHPPQTIAFWVLLTGIACLAFGSWLVPSSQVGPTFNAIIVLLNKTSLPFVGGRRAGDPPAPPSSGGTP